VGHEHEFPLEIPRARIQDGPHVQGVLNLMDNLEEDGGTQLVPGFHSMFVSWQNSLGEEQDWMFHPGQETNWLHPGDGGASFKFHEKDQIYALAQRIPMRQRLSCKERSDLLNLKLSIAKLGVKQYHSRTESKTSKGETFHNLANIWKSQIQIEKTLFCLVSVIAPLTFVRFLYWFPRSSSNLQT
jgi:hypothetical protein